MGPHFICAGEVGDKALSGALRANIGELVSYWYFQRKMKLYVISSRMK